LSPHLTDQFIAETAGQKEGLKDSEDRQRQKNRPAKAGRFFYLLFLDFYGIKELKLT